MYTTTLRESIEVRQPVSKCFRYLKDFSTIEQWDPGVYRAVKKTPGPVAFGTEFDLILSSFGRRIPMQYRLIEIEENCCLRLLGTADGVQADDRILFFPLSANTTRIIYEVGLTLRGVPEAMGPLIQPVLNRIGRQAIKGLASALMDDRLPPPPAARLSFSHKLLLPAALNFTERGYLSMPVKAHCHYMDGKTVVITGPTSGIGLAAACELSRLGAKLVLVGRGKSRLEQAAETIEDFAGAQYGIRLIEADLLSRRQTTLAAEKILRLEPEINVLINNAGALYKERMLTEDGLERSVAINLVAPFRLTQHLLPRLTTSRGRVINVSSGGQYLQAVNPDDLNYERAPFDGVKAYAKAKRALVSLTQSMAAQHPSVSFHAMHPGWASTPGVSSSLPTFDRIMKRHLRDSRMGADTLVWLASADSFTIGTGGFWLDRKPQPTDVIANTKISRRDAGRLLARLEAFA